MAASDRNPGVNPLNQEETILVLEQADLAAQSQIPLSPGLRAMAQEASSARVRRSLNALADRLEQGEPLAEVLSTLQPRLSPLMQTLIRQGAEIGRLDTVLHWASEQGRRRRTLQTQLWSSLAYPLVLLMIAFDIGAFILICIVPMFKKIFEDFGTQLPHLTVALLMIADFGTAYWIQLLGFGIPLILIAMTLAMRRSNWIVTRRWSVAIPLIGPLFRLSTLAEFCNLLAVFIDIQLPLDKAIRAAGEATSDLWLRDACGRLATDIESGMFNPRSAMDQGLPVAIGQMMHEATSAEALAEALHGLAEIYAARAELNSRAIGIVAEPFILLGTTIGLGTIVIALFMPLIKLLNDLS